MAMKPMNPLEWLATVLWDPTGRRREEQLRRAERSQRMLNEYDASSQWAMNQIRRTQRTAALLARLHRRG